MRNLTRRQAVKSAGAAGAALLLPPAVWASLPDDAAVAASSCAKLTPELTEGPYWVNTMLHRFAVRANSHGGGRQAGVPLNLYINVLNASNGCKPLNGVAVDIWHANA